MSTTLPNLRSFSVSEPPRTADAPAPAITAAPPVWKQVRSWVVLVPLLFYANCGEVGTAHVGAPSNAHRAGLLVVTATCAALILGRYRLILRALQRSAMVMALSLFALLSTMWSTEPRQTVVSATTLVVMTTFAVYFATTYTIEEQRRLLLLFGGMAFILSTLLAVLAPTYGAPGGNWCGVFSHKQQCGAYVALLLTTMLYFKPTTDLQRLLRVLFFLLGLVIEIMSGSRTGWMMTSLGVALFFLLPPLLRFAQLEALFLTFCAVPIILGAVVIWHTYSAALLSSVGKDPTLNQRTIIWEAVWNEVTKKLVLGYGYEGFWNGLAGASHTVIITVGWPIAQAQSGYLDLWLQTGVVSVAIFLLLLVQAVRQLLRLGRVPAYRSVAAWCLTIIACNLFFNISESDFNVLHLGWFLVLLACLQPRFVNAGYEPASTVKPFFGLSSHHFFHGRSSLPRRSQRSAESEDRPLGQAGAPV